jgi:hypothetical protein
MGHNKAGGVFETTDKQRWTQMTRVITGHDFLDKLLSKVAMGQNRSRCWKTDPA